MRAGKLRHRVKLEKPGLTQDPVTGEMVNGWQLVGTVWASVEALSVREYIQSQATQSAISARVTIRYRSDVDATMRLTHRGKIYNIEGALPDPDSGLEWLTLPCSEGVNDGQ